MAAGKTKYFSPLSPFAVSPYFLYLWVDFSVLLEVCFFFFALLYYCPHLSVVWPMNRCQILQ